MNHDIEPGVVGLASIKRWSAVAENFLPVAAVNIDTARLQRQIDELSAKMESTQMRHENVQYRREAAITTQDQGRNRFD